MVRDKSYSILKLNGSVLRLWDGPRLRRDEAVSTLKKRRKAYPKDTFFLYCTEWYYDAGVTNHARGKVKA